MATAYTGIDFGKASVKFFLAIFVAVIVWLYMDSLFLGFVVLAVLLFVPLPDEGTEKATNIIITFGLMLIVLFWAFGTIGGGIDLNLGIDPGLNIFGIVLLLLGIVVVIVRLTVWKSTIATLLASGLIIGGIIALSPWEWSFLTTIFIAAWIVAALGGASGIASGSSSSKAGTGMVLFIVVFFLFAGGVGTQQVGSAFFGQWWPQVYTMGDQLFGPIGDMISQLTGGASSAFEMISNPTAFAQRMLNGTYQRDPSTGLAGAYGVEIEELRMTPIYIGQGYQVILKLNNKGSYDASDISIKLSPGEKSSKGMTITEMGFTTDEADEPVRDMPKSYIEQVIFPKTGSAIIGCKAYNSFELYEKSLIYKAELTYDYSIDSSLDVEFISKEEWDRLAMEGKAITQAKKAATLKNSPAQLNIDSLEQPIRQGTPHFIGISLSSSQKKGTVKALKMVMEVPSEFMTGGKPEKGMCTPQGNGAVPWANTTAKPGTTILTWEKPPAGNTVYCRFDQYPASGIMSEPTKTAIIMASADFEFTTYKETMLKANIVGCCREKDCPEGRTCKGSDDLNPGTCSTETESA